MDRDLDPRRSKLASCMLDTRTGEFLIPLWSRYEERTLT
jgi:hypothetical protein